MRCVDYESFIIGNCCVNQNAKKITDIKFILRSQLHMLCTRLDHHIVVTCQVLCHNPERNFSSETERGPCKASTQHIVFFLKILISEEMYGPQTAFEGVLQGKRGLAITRFTDCVKLHVTGVIST